ncbi:unnamed protein product, partial [Mesorhabditis spiculigera]
MMFRGAILLLPAILIPSAGADARLPVDQEVRDGLTEAVDLKQLEAIANAEFAEYKAYLDAYVLRECGEATEFYQPHLPEDQYPKLALELQSKFNAKNVTNVRRVAELFLSYWHHAGSSYEYFACGSRGICRTYITSGLMAVHFWWGNARMSTKEEIDNWMVKTKDGSGLIERFRAKIFTPRDIFDGDKFVVSKFDLGLADDVMPAYTVRLWKNDDWKTECTWPMAPAPELAMAPLNLGSFLLLTLTYICFVVADDPMRNVTVNGGAWVCADGQQPISVTVSARDSSGKDEKSPQECRVTCLANYMVRLTAIEFFVNFKCPGTQKMPEVYCWSTLFPAPNGNEEPAAYRITLFGMLGESIEVMNREPILYAGMAKRADRKTYGEIMTLGKCTSF